MPEVFSFTECGGHALNEDVFCVQAHPSDRDCLICCLADGQGGQRGGARAAEIACRIALEKAIAATPLNLSKPWTWQAILAAADHAVERDEAAGFTTLIGMSLFRGGLSGASCGDSAALIISESHAIVATENQIKNPPVGSGGADFTPFANRLKAPWRVLAMSDGVWKFAGLDEVINCATKFAGNTLVSELQKRARIPSIGKFQDDFTIVVLEEIGSRSGDS